MSRKGLQEVELITAMVTPFDDEGKIAFDVLPELVEYLLSHGTQALLLAGTTGESPTLTHDEEIELFHAVIKINAGRVPIIVGVGTNDTRDSVEFVKEVAEIEGIDAGLAVVPYYNKPNQEGLFLHFKEIANASDLPIILYNVPGRTVASLNVETSLKLAEIDNIIAIKECTGIEAVSQLIENAPKGFLVYTGEDGLAFPCKALGAQGLISVMSHTNGLDIQEMFSELKLGNVSKAAKISRALLEKANALFSCPSPAPVKAVLNHRGIKVGGLRLPLVACTPEKAQEIISIIEK